MKRVGKNQARNNWARWDLAVSEGRAVRFTYGANAIVYQSFRTPQEAQKAIKEHLTLGIGAELIETKEEGGF